MKNTAALITDVRLVARNVANADGTYSITDAEIIRYLNDAQIKAQNKLSATKNIAKIFVSQSIISLVAEQAEYTITDRVLLNKQIEHVEYSSTGNATDYIRMEKMNFFNRDTNTSTYPWGYYKKQNQIVLQPTPSAATGSIRVMYERQIDDLAAVQDTVSGTPSGSSIVVTTGGASAFTANTYISVINAAGTVLLRNGLISTWTSGTKTILLTATVASLLQGSAVAADLASQNITVGAYTTNMSQLPDPFEAYLVHYAAAQCFHKDSSNDYDNEIAIADSLLKDILDSFKAQTGEVQFVPQMDRYSWW